LIPVLSASFVARQANGQTTGPPTWPAGAAEAAITKAAIDLSVPKSPAFTALGVTPDEVVSPSSPKMFATSLLNGTDARGNLQTGLAIDSTPYLAFFGNEVTLKDYWESYPTRFLARSQFSLATAKGTSSDDEAIRLGTGLRLTPMDYGDPRKDNALIKCFQKDLRSPEAEALASEIEDRKLEGATDEDVKELMDKLDEMTGATTRVCKQDSRARNWNRTAWSLGVAPTWISKKGTVGDLSFDAGSFWSTLGYGFERVPGLERSSQLLVSMRFNLDETVPDSSSSTSGEFRDQDTLTVAGQLRLAAYRPQANAAPSLILGVEGDYLRADPEDEKSNDSYRLSLGADVKLPFLDGAYLHLSAGGSGGGDDDSGFVLTNLAYGF
jgi:hypothetical protein